MFSCMISPLHSPALSKEGFQSRSSPPGAVKARPQVWASSTRGGGHARTRESERGKRFLWGGRGEVDTTKKEFISKTVAKAQYQFMTN